MKYLKWLQLAAAPKMLKAHITGILWLVVALAAPARGATGDPIDPCVVLTCPADRTVFTCGESATIRTYGVTAMNTCTGGEVDVVCDPPLPATLGPGIHPIKCNAVINRKVVATCAFNITVAVDAKPPTIECPQEINVETCNDSCLVVTYPPIAASDDSDEVVVVCQPPTGSCFPIGVTEVKCLARDRCQRTAECTFKVVVRFGSGEIPKIQCSVPIDVKIPCGQVCGVVTYPLPGVVNGVLVGCVPPSGSCFPVGISTVVCTAKNNCGQEAKCEFPIRVTAEAGVPAVITCPSDITVFSCGECETINYPQPTVVGGTLIGCIPPQGTCFPLGVSTVNCAASDGCGGKTECKFTVTVRPQQPTLIQCPAEPIDAKAPCDKDCATVNYTPPAVANGVLIGCNPPPATCFPIGISTVVCEALDDCGRITKCQFQIRVTRDQSVAPVITCPPDITVFACGDCEKVEYLAPVVVGGTLVSCSVPSGTCFPLGVTPVFCLAKNECGLTAECRFTVTVRPKPSELVIRCPEPIIVDVACEQNCATVNYPAPVVINGVLAGCVPPSGTCFPVGLSTVICTAKDECGRASECRFNVTVRPKPSELVIRCPEPILISVPCEQACAIVNYPPPVVVNGVLVGCVPPPGTCFPVGITTVTCNAKDECGREEKCAFTIRVVTDQTLAPVIECPQNIVVETCSNCEKVDYPAPVVTGGKLSLCSVPSGTCFPIGTTTVFCLATNECGASSECRFTVTVRPRPAVTILCPTAPLVVTAGCAQNCQVVNYPPPVVSDGVLVACNPPSGSCFPIGITPVVCVAKDECGREARCDFKVTVLPGEGVPPTITCPENITVEACGLCQTVLYPAPVVVGGSLVACIPAPGSCFPVGVTTVQCVAANPCAKSECKFTVTVRPKVTNLAIRCPENITITVPCGKPCEVVNYPAPVVVNGVLVACDPPSGTCFPLGTTSVACVAKDECGKAATCTFEIRVIPAGGVPATIVCPNNIAVETCSPCEPVFYPAPVVVGGGLLACIPPSGSCFPIGVNTVVCVATNECGLKSDCKFTVTVRPKTSDLVLRCPENITATAACDANCVVVNYPGPVVAGGTLVSCVPPSGTCFPVGLNPVICIAKDDCGRETKCRFLIRVIRETANPPVIRCPKDIFATVPCGQNCLVVIYPPPVVGNGVLVSCDPPSGKCFPIGPTIVTCVATNRCGQQAECKFTITVRPTTSTVAIKCPENFTVTIPCNKECAVVNYPRPLVSNGTLVSCTPPPGSCLPVGVHTVVCVAKDDCGHEAKCEFVIRVVRDQAIPPVIRCPDNLAVVVECGKDCSPVNYPPPVVVNGLLVGCQPPSGSCFPIGPTIVTCLATNDCGAKAECRFIVKVRPARPVAIHCPQEPIVVTVPCDQNCVVVNYPPPLVANGTLVECSPPPGSCFPVGIHTITCVAKDECGNQAGCEFRIRAIPAGELPLEIRCPQDIVVGTCEPCAVVHYPAPVVVNGVLLDCLPPSGSCFPLGITQVVCRAVNSCNQTSVCSFNVVVRPGAPCVRPPKNMVLWLPFDEPAGGIAHNVVTGAPHGLHFNGPVPFLGQKVDNSLGFDGQNDAVVVPNYAGLQFGRGNFSIDTWLLRRDDGGRRTIVSKLAAGLLGRAGYEYYLNNGIMTLALHTPGGGSQVFDSGIIVPLDNQWHFVAVTVDRTGGVPGARFYLDGNLVAVVNGGIAGSVNNYARLYVGTGSLGFALNPFRGFLDELEMFNRVLRPNEIRALWLADSAGKCKVKCEVPQNVTFAAGQECVTILARICNSTSVPQTVDWSATGLMPIPTPTGIVEVPPFSCVDVPVIVCRPLNQPVDTALPWNFSVEAGGRCPVICVGQILFPLRPIVVDLPEDPVSIPGTTDTANISVTLDGLLPGASLHFTVLGPDMEPDTDTVSLNGLPPGTPFILGGEAPASRAQPAAAIGVEVPVQFVLNDPSGTYTVLVQSDLDGDGTLEDLGSFAIENPAVNPPVVSVFADLLGVTIEWTDGGDGLGTLQGAENPEGPWTSIPEAVPGYRPDLDSPLRFFRVALGVTED